MDEMVQNLLDERNGALVAFLRIKESYRPDDDHQVFIAVEGKDDSSYYEQRTSQIFSAFGLECYFVLAIAGNKRDLVETHKLLDWACFDRRRILFFIDRDYSDFNDEVMPNGDNVYVTDGYALENSLCSEETFIRIMRQTCNQSTGLSEGDDVELRGVYRNAIANVSSSLRIGTIHQIAWSRRKELKSNLSNFEIKRYFKMDNKSIRPICTQDMFVDEMYKCCGVDKAAAAIDNSEIAELSKLIARAGEITMIARGKYVMEAFCLLVKGMQNVELASGTKFKNVGKLSTDGVQMTSAHASTPTSLSEFLRHIAGSFNELEVSA